MTPKIASAIFPLVLMAPLCGVAQQYIATDLGTLGGRASAGTGIDAGGQVTGNSETSGNAAIHAFLYSNGSMQDLGTLGGSSSEANGVNVSGLVTGGATIAADMAQHAFIYNKGALQDLGTLYGANSSGNGGSGRP